MCQKQVKKRESGVLFGLHLVVLLLLDAFGFTVPYQADAGIAERQAIVTRDAKVPEPADVAIHMERQTHLTGEIGAASELGLAAVNVRHIAAEVSKGLRAWHRETCSSGDEYANENDGGVSTTRAGGAIA